MEQFVLAKYYMTLNVYRHRVRLITDQMIVRAICLGIEVDEISELRELYSYSGDTSFFENYKKWDDARLLLRFSEGSFASSACGLLFRRLELRHLHKLVFSEKAKSFGDSQTAEKLLAIGKPENAALRRSLEAELAPIISAHLGCECHAHSVILHGFDVKSVRTSSRNDEAGIIVAGSDRNRPFEEESTLFASINEQYADGFVEVYAPTAWESRSHRQRTRRSLKDPIFKALSTGVPKAASIKKEDL